MYPCLYATVHNADQSCSLFFLLVSLGISLAIVVPLTGALVRLRANFNPKGLQLDAEGGVQPHTGPVVTSFFGMVSLLQIHRGHGTNTSHIS